MGGLGRAREQGFTVSAMAALLRHRAVVRTAQLAVGIVLAWAALAKLGDIPGLARDIHHYRLVPLAGENLLAIVLPWIELAAAVSLLLGIRARAGSLVAAGLMVVLTAAVALAIARGLNIECGCFGTAGAGRVGIAKLLENLAILTAAGVGTLLPAEAVALRSSVSP
jgi:putative oxidoreductase